MIRFFRRKRPVTASEIGRKGAQSRIAKAKAPVLAKARQMRVEMGLSDDPRLA